MLGQNRANVVKTNVESDVLSSEVEEAAWTRPLPHTAETGVLFDHELHDASVDHLVGGKAGRS